MADKSRRVYLDVCALCRPFDGQSAIRVLLETQAVHLILEHVRKGALQMISSPAHGVEIGASLVDEEKVQVFATLMSLGHRPRFDLRECRRQAEQLARGALGSADAAHVAFAVEAGADFVTCDDRLIKRARRMSLPIWIGNPVAYCEKEQLR